jgi:hypothetical protein
MNINISLLDFQAYLRIKWLDGQRFVFDPIRQKDIVLTSEETVRQLMIHYLHVACNFPMASIAVEKAIRIGMTTKRFDLLVYNRQFQPYLLIECKAPKVQIAEATFQQAAWYNFQLRADYLVVTNGMDTYCCLMDYEKSQYQFVATLPKGA